jgi:hypothetical protein
MQRFRAEQTRAHNRQRGIFCARYFYLALQFIAANDQQFLHFLFAPRKNYCDTDNLKSMFKL